MGEVTRILDLIELNHLEALHSSQELNSRPMV
jgi:hypothetical protein